MVKTHPSFVWNRSWQHFHLQKRSIYEFSEYLAEFWQMTHHHGTLDCRPWNSLLDCSQTWSKPIRVLCETGRGNIFTCKNVPYMNFQNISLSFDKWPPITVCRIVEHVKVYWITLSYCQNPSEFCVKQVVATFSLAKTFHIWIFRISRLVLTNDSPSRYLGL